MEIGRGENLMFWKVYFEELELKKYLSDWNGHIGILEPCFSEIFYALFFTDVWSLV